METCIDTYWGVRCSCGPGWKLQDGQNCTGMDLIKARIFKDWVANFLDRGIGALSDLQVVANKPALQKLLTTCPGH